MANETEKTILPYLNVLEVETIDKSNVTKVIVIDKDDEVKVMDGSQLGTNSYFDIQNKPQINSVELSGNKSLSDLGIQPAGNYIEAGTGTQPQINTITVLTQSEYDGLSTKDPNTQYLIVE